jgi:hypothetical protein
MAKFIYVENFEEGAEQNCITDHVQSVMEH